MNLFKKKDPIKIPINNAIENVNPIKTWTVSWWSRCGAYSSNLNKEFEVFTSEEEARKFKAQLEAAFALVRHTSNIDVNLKENK